nr:MFS transporter [uncultured Ottowia sp.]
MPAAAPAPATPPLTLQEWALLASAYLSQFVASGFFFMAMTAILRDRGVPLEQIGWLYMLGMAPGLKFLWAPLLDRYGFGKRGHYGTWLALMQALLLATLLWLAALPMRESDPAPLAALLTGCALVSILTSWQDIAADGLSCRLLGPAQRGLGNAMQMACGMLGFAAGGGGVLMAYERWGWQSAILGLALLNAVTLAQALLYREPPHARPAPEARPSLGAQWLRLWRFWRQPGTGWRWAALIATANSGVCMAYMLLTPMLVDAGWSMSKIGEVVNVYGTLIGSASMLALGAFIRRWSAARAMPWVMAVQALAVAALAAALLLALGDDRWVLAGVAAYMALYTPLDVLMPTLMMGRASAGTPATDFSMQHGIYTSMGLFVAGALAMQAAAAYGYGAALVLSLAASVLAGLAAPWLWRSANERQARAEKAAEGAAS